MMIFSNKRVIGALFSIVLLGSIISSLFLAACRPRDAHVRRELEAMNSPVELIIPVEDMARLGDIQQTTLSTIQKLDRLTSLSNPDSEVSGLNRVAGMVRLPVAEETHRLIRFAVEFAEKTSGAFDITIAPLAYLWGFQGGHIPEQGPTAKELRSATRGVGISNIRIEEKTIQLTSPYTRIDLGGIVKGYAIDLSILSLYRKGVKNLLIDFGGQARCLGMAGPDLLWSRDIPHPEREGSILGTIFLTNGMALATSQLYADSIMIEGIHYGHVLDPRTGWPAKGTLQVTAVAPTATEADALATALLVLGVEKGWETLEKFPRCEALFVPEEKPFQLWITEGLEKRFVPTDEFKGRVQVLHRK